MEIEVLEQEKNRLKFRIHGAGHTFCNNLKTELYNDKDIHVAAYRVDHPLIGIPTFIVEKTGTSSFSKILANAADRVKKKNKDFAALVKKIK